MVINRGQLGMVLRALSESPTMLATHGLASNITRLIVFCTSAFLAGVAGALRVSQTGAVGASEFGPVASLLLLVVLAIAGTGLVRTPMLAAFLIAVLPGYASSFGSSEQLLAFGLAAIAIAVLYASQREMSAWFSGASARAGARRTRGPVRARAEQVVR
jgi:ABC-type branched-subunit amino acid transport system permease subunit